MLAAPAKALAAPPATISRPMVNPNLQTYTLVCELQVVDWQIRVPGTFDPKAETWKLKLESWNLERRNLKPEILNPKP